MDIFAAHGASDQVGLHKELKARAVEVRLAYLGMGDPSELEQGQPSLSTEPNISVLLYAGGKTLRARMGRHSDIGSEGIRVDVIYDHTAKQLLGSAWSESTNGDGHLETQSGWIGEPAPSATLHDAPGPSAGGPGMVLAGIPVPEVLAMMNRRRHGLVLLLLALVWSCGSSADEFREELQGAAECAAEDACVVVNFDSECLCSAVINEARVMSVQDAARAVDCQGRAVDCLALTNPRCERGRCVAD